MKAGLGQVGSMQCRYKFFLIAPDGSKFQHGDYEFGVKGEKKYLRGVETALLDSRQQAVTGVSQISYEKHLAFDGKQLYVFTPSGKAGKIAEEGDAFVQARGPWCLLGHGWGILPPYRDLTDLLKDAEFAEQQPDEREIVLLESRFQERYPSGGNTQEWIARVWCDTAHGYLPRRVDLLLDVNDRQVYHRLDSVEFHKLDGTWLPISGTITGFSVKEAWYNNGMEMKEYYKLKKEQREGLKIVRTVMKVIGKPERYEVDLASLQINKEIPHEKFSIQFPNGTVVLDAFKQETFQVQDGEWVPYDVHVQQGSENVESQSNEKELVGFVTLGFGCVFVVIGCWLYRHKFQVGKPPETSLAKGAHK